jgi:hypothetical protein
MKHDAANQLTHNAWSRRSFIQATGAGLATGVAGGVFQRRAAAADGPGGIANQPEVVSGLAQARQILRNEQAKYPTRGGVIRSIVGESTLTPALAFVNERRNFHPSTKVAGYVSRSGYTFDPKLEERRIALAEDLIRRTDPGPFEDPNYLALMAYQTASVELALSDNIQGQNIDWGWSRFLLGTIHSPEVQSQSLTSFFQTSSSSQDYTIVWLNSALIEYFYQAAKALIAALHPVWSTVPGTTVTFEFTEQHIRDELARNQEPVERLYRTLEAYFFAGYPRAYYNESVPEEHRIPLNQLIDITERWVIAHEYGHGFAARMGFAARAYEQDNVHAGRAEEYFSDDNATILTVMSAARLDAVRPHVSLAGPAFALACVEVLRRGLSVLRCDRVLRDTGDSKHPPNEMRIRNVLTAFDFYFEDNSPPDGSGIDLNLVHRPPDWKPVDSEERKQLHAATFRWANALLMIWDKVRPRLHEDRENKRPLHPMWDPACPA